MAYRRYGIQVATAKETLIQYKVEFKIGGVTVATKYYTVETEEVEEPAIPEKAGYTATWEKYELNGGDKVVNAVYTAIEKTDDSSSTGTDGDTGSEEQESCSSSISSMTELWLLCLIALAVIVLRSIGNKKKNNL